MNEAIQYLKKMAARETYKGKNADYCRGYKDGSINGAVRALEAAGLITCEQGNEFILQEWKTESRNLQATLDNVVGKEK